MAKKVSTPVPKHDHKAERPEGPCTFPGCEVKKLCGKIHPELLIGCNLPDGHKGPHENTFFTHFGQWKG